MITKTVDIHAEKIINNEKTSGRLSDQNKDNGKKSLKKVIERDQNCTLKMRCTRFKEEKGLCPACHSLFTIKRSWHRFCSAKCRRKYHRVETRNAILIGMVTTAKALTYTKEEFISKIKEIWECN